VDAETTSQTIPTCYRHGDRETRLSCSNCGRPICVECTRTAPVGQKCPECAAPTGRSKVITAGQLYGGTLRQRAPVVFGLIAASVAAFLVLPALSPELLGNLQQSNRAVAEGQVWRLATAAFLHAGLLHIGFNMYALYLFGPGIERQVGSVPFLSLYLGTAMAGGAAFYVYDVLTPGGAGSAVGASGAIFGLFGAALAAAYSSRRTVAGREGLRSLLTLLAINAVIPLAVPQIAWQAHAGGLVAGFAIATAWRLIGTRSGAAVARTLVGAAVGAISLAVVLVL